MIFSKKEPWIDILWKEKNTDQKKDYNRNRSSISSNHGTTKCNITSSNRIIVSHFILNRSLISSSSSTNHNIIHKEDYEEDSVKVAMEDLGTKVLQDEVVDQ